MSTNLAQCGNVTIGAGHPLVIIAGPCVMESPEHTLRLAEEIARICRKRSVPLIFKASYDKANRSSVHSFRGPGMEEGLRILSAVRSEFGIPILSDMHSPEQAQPAGEVLDCLQIPAFLCRQTDLIAAAARTGKCVNVKKGQFLSPHEMSNVADKLRECDCTNFLFTERGTTFGYNRLINDMTSIPIMQAFAPVVFDATHSCQLPGAAGTQSGGQRQFVPTLTAAAVAAGADAVFLEVHDNPDRAKSDPATVYPLDQFDWLLVRILPIAELVRSM
ncbi:MAG: 3-deoxy-8-phosphooctulonate synthase [Planctomycetota bacterium]